MTNTARPAHAARPELGAVLGDRVVVADGAMGTMLQASDATLEDFDGHEGCNRQSYEIPTYVTHSPPHTPPSALPHTSLSLLPYSRTLAEVFPDHLKLSHRSSSRDPYSTPMP